MKKIFIFLIILSVFSLSLIGEEEWSARVNSAIRAFHGISVDDYKEHEKNVMISVSILDNHEVQKLITHPRYVTAGNVYVCYARLMHDKNDLDEEIRAYEKAIYLRKDPVSLLQLATCYKKKYNAAVKKGDIDNEILFGRKVYESLSTFLRISRIRDESKWYSYRDYFAVYAKTDNS